MTTTETIRQRVRNWQHDRFRFGVHSPNVFTTIIELHYVEPWLGPQYDDVSDVKSVYEIRYAHDADEFQLLVPTATCANQKVPEPDHYTIDRDGMIVHETLDAVEAELYDGIEHELPLFSWLADFIERWRFQRYSEVLPGVGPVNSQRLYDEYHCLRALHEAPFDELDDTMRTAAAEQFPPIHEQPTTTS